MKQKLPEEIKAKWLEALRSGKYRQGNGYLRWYNSYCCLGVLYDCMGGQWESPFENTHAWKPKGDDNVHGYLQRQNVTLDVWNALTQEVDEEDPDNGGNFTVQRKLAYMNDHTESFDAIADWIEREL